MSCLVVVPARKGSKGVPGKNKKILGTKPLIQYTIEAAKEVFPNDQICISTDDLDIIKIAQELSVEPPFLRPDYLSSDLASSQEVLLHAINYYENMGHKFDRVVLLQVTSPFRNGQHVREAYNLYNDNIDMVVSVCESKSNPYFNLFEQNDAGFLSKSKKSNYTRRQDCPKIYEFNGAIYVINKNSLKNNAMVEFEKIVKYEMDELSSHDIDTPFDWDLAEMIYKIKK